MGVRLKAERTLGRAPRSENLPYPLSRDVSVGAKNLRKGARFNVMVVW